MLPLPLLTRLFASMFGQPQTRSVSGRVAGVWFSAARDDDSFSAMEMPAD